MKKQDITRPADVTKFEGEGQFVNILFLVTSLLYIGIQLLSFSVIGIPLLLGSHVDIYSGAGGWGILGHFIDVLKPLSVFLLIYYLFNETTSLFFYLYKYFFLVVLLVFFALSGSRSEFMIIGFVLFCFLALNGVQLNKYFNNLRRYEIIILSLGLVFVFFTIAFQSNGKEGEPGNIYIFLFRLVASGDAYYFSYPDHQIDALNTSQPFLALFGSVLSTLRLMPRESQPEVFGYQLFKLYGESDAVVGPNARHNVFGLAYFGFYGSIVFSYLVGLSLSFTRNKIFTFSRKSVLSQGLYVLVYLNMAVIETDPPMVIANLENLFLILPFVVLVSFFIFVLMGNYRLNSQFHQQQL